MNPRRILIAGIGNIFFGDDAFGVEAAMALIQRPQPEEVTVREFGVHGHDLAIALCDGYDAAILINANPRGKAPGSVSMLELELPAFDANASVLTSGHGVDPIAVLQLAVNFGAQVERLYLVGCEPAVLEAEEGERELSPPVRAALPRAIGMVEALVADLLQSNDRCQKSPVLAAHV